MARIVLIDGENLLYGLRKLSGGDEIAPRDSYNSYNFRGLIEDILVDEKPSQILWFGARLRRYEHTTELLEKTKRAIFLQSKLVSNLQRQKIDFIKVGYLRARESEPCPKCGHTEWRLQEKGVDVGLAARMLQEASPERDIILVSADTDQLPAIKVAKKAGAKVMFVGYENQPIAALSQQAYATRLITKPQVEKYMEKNEQA